MIDPNESPEILDEEERYVQALERAKAPPEPEPPNEGEPKESPENPPTEAGSSVVAAEKSEPPKFDLASLSPEARAEFERLQQDFARERHEKQALLGRVPRLQSDLDRLQSQARTSQQAPPAPPAVPTDQDSKAYFDSSDWKEHERDFPKEAAVQRKILEAAFARAEKAERASQDILKKVEEKFGTFDSFVQEQTYSRETHALNEAHPDWKDLVFPKTQDDAVQLGQDGNGNPLFVDQTFASWLLVQDEDKQRWFSSDSAAKNIRLMDDFKRDLYLANLHAQQSDPSPARTPASPRRSPDIDPTPRVRQTNPVSRQAASGDPEEEEYVAALERTRASVR